MAFSFFFKNQPLLSIIIIPVTVILFLILLNNEIKAKRRITFLKNRIRVIEVEIDSLPYKMADRTDYQKAFAQKGQYDDDYTPSVRMLFDDELIHTKVEKPKVENPS